jgi:hypothetical protein
MGRKKPHGIPDGGFSKMHYKCKVCHIRPRGCDLPKHYESNTNWELLSEMKECVGDAALARLEEKADQHTAFMYKNKYTKESLPKYSSHPVWRGDEPAAGGEDAEASDGSPSMKKAKGILGYFSKKVFAVQRVHHCRGHLPDYHCGRHLRPRHVIFAPPHFFRRRTYGWRLFQ